MLMPLLSVFQDNAFKTCTIVMSISSRMVIILLVCILLPVGSNKAALCFPCLSPLLIIIFRSDIPVRVLAPKLPPNSEYAGA